MRKLQTVPSLSGTFSIHARLTLNPKMLKEPSSPSHTIVLTVKHCSKIETFELNEENSQHITSPMVHSAISASLFSENTTSLIADFTTLLFSGYTLFTVKQANISYPNFGEELFIGFSCFP